MGRQPIIYVGRITDDGQIVADDPVAMPGADVVVLVSCEGEAFHYMRHWVDHLLACHPGTFLANAAGWNNVKH